MPRSGIYVLDAGQAIFLVGLWQFEMTKVTLRNKMASN